MWRAKDALNVEKLKSRLVREIFTRPVQEVMVDDDSDGSLGSRWGEECTICRDSIEQGQPGELVGVFTGCGERHPIHEGCRDQLIRFELQNRRLPRCPTCRRPIRLRQENEGDIMIRPEPNRFVYSLTQVIRSLFGGCHGLGMGVVFGITFPIVLETVSIIALVIIAIIVIGVVAILAALGGQGDCDNCGDCGHCDCDNCCASEGAADVGDCCFYNTFLPLPYDPFWGYGGYGNLDCNCDCSCSYRRTWRCGQAREWFEIFSQALFIPGVIIGIFIGCRSGLFMIGLNIMGDEMNFIASMSDSTTHPFYVPLSTTTIHISPTLPTYNGPPATYTTTMHILPAPPKLFNFPKFLSN